MKLAITGKGGVGKTTTCALLARHFADNGHRVLAIDADPNATLAACLGFPNPESIPAMNTMADLIEERTGVRPGAPGAVYKLNPKVDDIVERFSVPFNGIRLLKMGVIKAGGAGCYCPENAFLQTLVSHLFLGQHDILLMDMEAGVEHLGRATVRGVDWLLIMAEPSRQSLDTARRIQTLAADLGIAHVGVIANKCREAGDVAFLADNLAPLPVLGALPYDDALRVAEREGRPPQGSGPEVASAIAAIVQALTA